MIKSLFLIRGVIALVAMHAVSGRPLGASEKRQSGTECGFGEWQCAGSTLQRCFNDKWNDVRTCTSGTVCSSTGASVGCIWEGQEAGMAGSPESPLQTPSHTPVNSPTTLAPTPTTQPSISSPPAQSASGVSSTSKIPSSAPSTSPASSVGQSRAVIYSDLSLMPSDPESVKPYTHFLLAFWLLSGPTDMALEWQNLGSTEQQAIRKRYNDAGIKLMVSAFGSTDTPVTSGADAVQIAGSLTQFVKANNLDGIDIDFEDALAFNSGTAEAWLITLQTELRKQLPEPYIISHAPQAPWFTTNSMYPGGGYLKIHQAVGHTIDWYNIQFFNQGTSAYSTCQDLIEASHSFPGTAVLEMQSASGIGLNKIVIGKPMTPASATNGGYMSPSDFSSCVTQAKNSGWDGGVMYWQWCQSAISTALVVLEG